MRSREPSPHIAALQIGIACGLDLPKPQVFVGALVDHVQMVRGCACRGR